MNSFAWSSILTFILSLGLGGLVYYRNKKRLLNRLWFAVSMSISLWSLGLFGIVISKNMLIALAWQNLLDVSAIFVAAFFLHFTLVLVDLNRTNPKKYKTIILTSYLITFALLIFSFTPYFKKGVSPVLNFNYWINPGILYLLFPIIFACYILYSIFLLYNGYRTTIGIRKGQIKYVLISMLIGFLGGSTNFLPQLIEVYPVGNYFVMFYIIFITYSITRYRLMDIRLVILRSLAFGFIVAIITIAFAGISGLIATIFQGFVGVKSNLIAGLIIGILVSVTYQPVRKVLEHVTNSFLYKKRYNPDILIKKINEVASSILNLEQLLTEISKTLAEAFNSEKFGVALLNNKKLEIAFKEGFEPGSAEKLVGYKNIVEILRKEVALVSGILVIDEMKTKYENGEFKPVSVELLYALHQSDIALVVPLFSKDKLIGIMAVGTKKSGDPYNQQDLSALGIISGQVAISIENARLYDELKDFNITLQQKVAAATKELRAANTQLKEMDRMKSDFISIASHQLRTPLTVIKGYISMLREGSFGKVSPHVLEQLEKVFIANERLIGLVENLLDISRIESGRQEYSFQKTDLVNMASTVVENLKRNAKNVGLQLTFKKPSKKIPLVLADKKLHEVMMNFVDNAIKYTKKGKIEVSILPEPKGMVTFEVKDTGIGLTKESLSHLFRKFSRAKGSFQIHTEGLGLGLFVAKMLIDAHHGIIGAESAGLDTGSKFFFSIPIQGVKSEFKPQDPVCKYLGK